MTTEPNPIHMLPDPSLETLENLPPEKKADTPPSKLATSFDKITDSLISNFYIILSFLITTFVLLYVYYANDMVPFGDKTILRMDLYHQYAPFMAELFERISSGSSFFYSWFTGLGGSFLGNFYNYLSSPVSLLILLFKQENIPEAISFIILIKSALASSTFCYYLKKSVGRQNLGSVAFSILYASSGYFLAYYWNIMWLDGMYLLPLVLLGIERIINSKKMGVYCFSFALLLFSSYYMALMVAMFSGIYFFAYFFIKNAPEANGTGKNLISRIGKFVVANLTSFGLAAFAVIPTYFALQATSAVGGGFPKDLRIYFNFFDFMSNHLAGVTTTIRSSGEDVLPNIYCGVIVFILFPLYLFSKSISRREKTVSLFILTFLVLSFNTNYLNFIWHGLHFPNDLPYRASFIYSFILLIMCYKAFIRIREFTGKDLILSVVGATAFITLAEKIGSKNITKDSIIVSMAFLVVYVILCLCFYSKKIKKWTFTGFLLISIFLELVIATPNLYDIRIRKYDYSHDLNDVKTVISDISQHDNGVYRMEFSSYRTLNDPAWFGYKGVTTFSSMAYERLSGLQNALGLKSNNINSYAYRMQTPVYNAMFNLKYFMAKDYEFDPNLYEYQFESPEKSVTALKNKYSLPIGFMADNQLLDWASAPSHPDPFDLQEDFICKALNNNSMTIFEPLKIETEGTSSISNEEGVYFTSFGNGSNPFTCVSSNKSDPSSFTVFLNPQKKQHLYAYVGSYQLQSFNVHSPNTSLTYNDGLGDGFVIDLGVCGPDDEVSITMNVDSNNANGLIDFYAYGFNMEKFKEAYDQLNQETLQKLVYSDTYLQGEVTTSGDKILYTSIPYDKGWTIKVDGQKVDPLKVGDALIAVPLQAGTHNIEFRFIPQGLILGIFVTIVTLSLLIVFWILKRKGAFERISLRRSAAKDMKRLTDLDIIDGTLVDFSTDLDLFITPENNESFVPETESFSPENNISPENSQE